MTADGPEVKIERLLDLLLRNTGLELTYTVETVAGEVPAARLLVRFEGPDSAMLVAHGAELLLAMEHLAARSLGLSEDQHDRISFEAGGFKAAREQRLRLAAQEAVARVRATGQPYHFAPMNSMERRMLHLLLAPSGLRTGSEGEGRARRVVLYAVGGV